MGNAITLETVTRRFGPKTAVDGLSLHVPLGSVFGLIGPNGAGKTTTFSMIAGYMRPSSGSIRVLDFEPDHTDALRGKVGVLPQDAVLPPLETVGEFLTSMAKLQDLPKAQIGKAVTDVLAEVQGSTWLGTRCSALSHGMAKRVGLAQALLGNPDLILLDEPTAGLDPRMAHEVREIITRRKGRSTLLISSHNLHELEQICDHAAIIDRGKLVVSGSMADLTASSAEVRIKLAPGPVPFEQVQQLPMVTRVEFVDDTRDLVVYFENATTDAETVIGATLGVLLHAQARISGVTKGKGLERRVMDLTGALASDALQGERGQS